MASEIIAGKAGLDRHLKVSEQHLQLRLDVVNDKGEPVAGVVLSNEDRYTLVKAILRNTGLAETDEYGTITVPKPIQLLRIESTSELFGHRDYNALSSNEKFIVNRYTDMLEKARRH